MILYYIRYIGDRISVGGVLFALIAGMWSHEARYTWSSFIAIVLYIAATMAAWMVCPFINVLAFLMRGFNGIPVACSIGYTYANESTMHDMPSFMFDLRHVGS